MQCVALLAKREAFFNNTELGGIKGGKGPRKGWVPCFPILAPFVNTRLAHVLDQHLAEAGA
jgi:hypothetical protein